jgi:starch synthase
VPLYLKKAMSDDPHFINSKVIYSVYDNEFTSVWDESFKEKLKIDGIEDSDLEILSPPDYVNLTKLAISMSDGIIQGSEKINPEIEKFIKESGKPFLGFHSEDTYIAAYNEFYDKMLD